MSAAKARKSTPRPLPPKKTYKKAHPKTQLRVVDSNLGKSRNGAHRTEEIIQSNPDVKSFIYQQIAEFQPFVTPTTVAAVVAKDPLKLAMDFEVSGARKNKLDLSRLHRISIHLRDQDSQIYEEASHENIFEAIRLAKVKLLGRLVEIQDQVISKEERIEEIHQVLQNNQKH